MARKKVADMTPEELAERYWLKMLGWAFAVGVNKSDVRFIRYKAYRKKGVVTSLYLTDVEQRLGHMWVDLTKQQLAYTQYEGVDLGALLQFLIGNGAKEKAREKRVRMTPFYD